MVCCGILIFTNSMLRPILFFYLLLSSSISQADCFDDAANYHRVKVSVLRAIAMQENSRCDATIRKNTDRSIDVGCMQINSVHFNELSRHNIYPSDLLDKCKNIYVGAWHYKKKIIKYGDTWQAVGAYHSETPGRRDAYAYLVYKIWVKMAKQ